jgi:hypothetical protein
MRGAAIPLAVCMLAAPSASQPSLRDVLARTGQYTIRWGETFSTIVADEEYTQQLVAFETTQVVETRVLRSEIAFVRLSGSPEWLALRSVLSVDGAPVDDAGRLERVLRAERDSSLAQARAIADESSRHNLGPLVRNFNVPTIVLQFLHPANQARFRFSRKGEEDRGGERVWWLAFEERERPTFIRAPGGKSLPVRGRVWVAPDTGRIGRTELVVDDFHPPVRARLQAPGRAGRSVTVRSRAEIAVTFRPDARLGQWVPSEMRERYEGAWPDGGPDGEPRHYEITGTATYTNFRRFDVDIRIRAPGRLTPGGAPR